MSINSEIARISNAKLDLGTVLTARSVVIPQGSLLDDYPELLESVLSLCAPYAFDFQNGYINESTWKYEVGDNNCNDVYKVTEGNTYTIFYGGSSGTRFRCLFVTQNILEVTYDVPGTLIYAKNGPSKWERIVTENTPTHTWVAPEDGYVIVQKDNVGTLGLRVYVLDLTSIDNYPTPDPYEDDNEVLE